MGEHGWATVEECNVEDKMADTSDDENRLSRVDAGPERS